jgi:hypothetical protein
VFLLCDFSKKKTIFFEGLEGNFAFIKNKFFLTGFEPLNIKKKNNNKKKETTY